MSSMVKYRWLYTLDAIEHHVVILSAKVGGIVHILCEESVRLTA